MTLCSYRMNASELTDLMVGMLVLSVALAVLSLGINRWGCVKVCTIQHLADLPIAGETEPSSDSSSASSVNEDTFGSYLVD
jgi:hypothetical protein